MEARAERVKQLNCGTWGKPLDPAKYKPLSSLDCPECGGRMTVPALFGDFFLTAIVGRGAAGIVCKALDEKLTKPDLADQALLSIYHRRILIAHTTNLEGYKQMPDGLVRVIGLKLK